MAEAFDATSVVQAAVPTKVEGKLIGCNWTGDRCLSWIDLHLDYLTAEDIKCGEGRIEIGPGRIAEAIGASYEADDDSKPTVDDIWTQARTAVGDGTGLTPAAAATFVASKPWGQWLLRQEWKKSAVK